MNASARFPTAAASRRTGPDRDPLLFTPIPQSRPRADGWTGDRQIAFIAALARTGVVTAAARSVGMTARSANQLRVRAGPQSGFARAWAVAVSEGQTRAIDFALEQSSDPDMVPVMRRGRHAGWRARDAGRLAFAALQALDGLELRYGSGAREQAAVTLRNFLAPESNEISERPGKSGS